METGALTESPAHYRGGALGQALELVEAVRRHGRVGVAAIVGQEIFNQQVVGTKPVRPFPALLDAAAVWGMVETPDGEGAARQHYQGQFNIPSLAWKAAGLVTSNLPAMTEPRWMNYYGPPGTLPHESYHRVLAGTTGSAFSNKVVYFGTLFSVAFTGGKGTDDWRTPYTRWAAHPKSPGVDILSGELSAGFSQALSFLITGSAGKTFANRRWYW